MFSWSERRRLSIFIIFAAVVCAIVGAIIYFFWNGSNTTNEIIQPKDLVILWSRVFPVREGVVDAAALLENPNTTLRSSKFTYSIKLYDADNILVAVRDGATFINPGERFLVFEPTVVVQNRKPSRAIVTIRDIVWEKTDALPVLPLSILQTQRLLEDPTPHVEALIKNQSNDAVGSIEASAVLWNASDEVLGVSRTVIEAWEGNEEKKLIFTWPEPIAGVERAEILLRRIPHTL